MKKHKAQYKELIATVSQRHLDSLIPIMKTQDGKSRMESVINAIEETRLKILNGEVISDKERQNLANDIGIWFANEICEGRGDGGSIQ